MKITALAGGVGGAKLADGLAQLLPAEDLTVIVNTGDDFEHFGLHVSPDLDTVCYTLAGSANPDTGWGRSGESFTVLQELSTLGQETWFRLGDQDLATHIYRNKRLKEGAPLSLITRELCAFWEIRPTILPMTDQPVQTKVITDVFGILDFQDYFVRHHCEPVVRGFRFDGVETAVPAPGVLEALESADAVVFCPSNPWVSIDPILSLPGVRGALGNQSVVAVSPLIDGKTVKGPAAKMFIELGIPATALSVAEHYGSLLAAFILDDADRKRGYTFPIPVLWTNTLMKTSADRRRLAQDVLNLIRSL
jgi:LPPG:FO 2-phospho-L-lactate transferase